MVSRGPGEHLAKKQKCHCRFRDEGRGKYLLIIAALHLLRWYNSDVVLELYFNLRVMFSRWTTFFPLHLDLLFPRDGFFFCCISSFS